LDRQGAGRPHQAHQQSTTSRKPLYCDADKDAIRWPWLTI
jgi:hypothetical protein